MKVDAKQTVSGLIEGPILDEGFELAEVVVSRYKNTATVRVFVYGKDGVSIDQCAHLSRVVGDIIDGTDLFKDGYNLEVSSPGLDRPLTTSRDFRYRVGETVKLEFTEPLRKKLKGEIVEAGEDKVVLQADDETLTIDLADIKEARIVF